MARGARVREQGSDKTVDARQESQPPYLYPDYVATRLRAPKKPLIILPRSLSDTTAPAFGHGHVGELDNDLTRQHDGEPLGERIIVTGRVLDGDGRPLRNSLIEIWQANEAGRYTDPTEDREKPPHDRDTFSGFGRTGTDADGRFSFVTVKPGPVPCPDGSLQALEGWPDFPLGWIRSRGVRATRAERQIPLRNPS
jgi:protocatechuate 3,4-dioxygenase beta subunit